MSGEPTSAEGLAAAGPLHDRLDALERRWRGVDEGFAAALERGEASLELAVEQTRCFGEHAAVLVRELAMLPSLRVALVREGMWSPEQALASCLRYRPNLCGHLIELLPALPDALIPELVAHTRGSRWRGHEPLDHSGVWVTKRAGGESLLPPLCARLAARGDGDEARRLLAEIEHPGARVLALEALRELLSPAELDAAITDLLARCRGLDPIRRLYASCEASRLLAPPQALALVEQAIAGLPDGHEWVHYPGGLMVMLLAEPIIDALDREGLREHLIAWAEREADLLWPNLLDGYAERLASVLGRPAPRASEHTPPSIDAVLDEAARGNLSPLLGFEPPLPDSRIAEVVKILQAAASEQPSEPWRVLVLARADARARALGLHCAESAFEVLDNCVTEVRWDRYGHPQPIWTHPEFAEIDASARRRVLRDAVDDVRASASLAGIEWELKVIDARLATGFAEHRASVDLGRRWLAAAREGADPGLAGERWRIAAELWGPEGLTAIRLVLAELLATPHAEPQS